MEIIEGNIIAIHKGWAGQPDWHPHIVRFLGANEVSKGMVSLDAKDFWEFSPLLQPAKLLTRYFYIHWSSPPPCLVALTAL